MTQKTHSITTTIRMDAATLIRLDEASSLQQISRADLIRTSIQRVLTEWEQNGRQRLLLDLLTSSDMQTSAPKKPTAKGRKKPNLAVA